MSPRDKDRRPLGEGEDPFADYCPSCGSYAGGDSVCPNCGSKIFDDSGLEERDEDDEREEE